MFITIPLMSDFIAHYTVFNTFSKKSRASRVLKVQSSQIDKPFERVDHKALVNFKLKSSETEFLPFQLLGRYVNSSNLPQATKDVLYEKIHNRHTTIATDISSALLEEKEIACVKGNLRQYREAYQIEKLLAKYPFTGNAKVCRSNAISRFFEAEDQCRDTNRRLKATFSNRNYLPSQTNDAIHRAKEIIAQVLGSLDILSLVKNSRPGPGSVNTDQDRRPSETTAYFKYRDKISVTRSARWFATGMIAQDSHWLNTCYAKAYGEIQPLRSTVTDLFAISQNIENISSNRITFVPKDSTTDRAIAIEPGGNVMLQLGVGVHIKDRLSSWGINLRSQTKNQALARIGSLESESTADLATIDLAMASDTISIETVRWLLPREWYNYLCSLRCSSGSLKTDSGITTVEYEKFSSMGNGFTFELESLIFFALTLATHELHGLTKDYRKELSVFGDDIVCNTSIVDDLTLTFKFLGFSINHSKSFTSGPFRESCGKDYFLGHDVRPFFLRRKITSVRDLHFVSNSILYKGVEQAHTLFWEAYELLFSKIPRNYVLPGPMSFSIDIADKQEHYRDRENRKTLSLESCLRVPLSWAINNGYYRFDPYTQSTKYRELAVNTSKSTKPYTKESGHTAARYHIFLQGVKGGHIVLRGVTQTGLKTRTSSQWDVHDSSDINRHPLSFMEC